MWIVKEGGFVLWRWSRFPKCRNCSHYSKIRNLGSGVWEDHAYSFDPITKNNLFEIFCVCGNNRSSLWYGLTRKIFSEPNFRVLEYHYGVTCTKSMNMRAQECCMLGYDGNRYNEGTPRQLTLPAPPETERRGLDQDVSCASEWNCVLWSGSNPSSTYDQWFFYCDIRDFQGARMSPSFALLALSCHQISLPWNHNTKKQW